MILTFTSDFGLKDSYVAEVKAVLLSICPNLTIVDITHDIPKYDIDAAAFHLKRAYSYFPPTTYHLVIVDPGVGTERKCVFVKTAHGCFIGPDNGVLYWAIEDAVKKSGKPVKAFEIPVSNSASSTFHGRDVFAPFLGHHLKGKKTRLKRMEKIEGHPFPEVSMGKSSAVAEIIHIDTYGNLITNLSLKQSNIQSARTNKSKILPADTYKDIPQGKCALIKGSHGFWEVAANSGSAAEILGIKKPARVTFELL